MATIYSYESYAIKVLTPSRLVLTYENSFICKADRNEDGFEELARTIAECLFEDKELKAKDMDKFVNAIKDIIR